MPYTLIKGELHIHNPVSPRNGPEPDGDTLRFRPDTRELIDALPKPNQPASFNRAGQTSIRFEGIDALETHFFVNGEETHQRFDLSLGQRDALLGQIGFGAIKFFDDKPFVCESVEFHPRRAWILSNGLDTYGRTIAFVFAGDTAVEDGSRIFVTPEMLDTSLNAFMLRTGNAYAAFYLTLPAELREHLRAIVAAARRAGTGVWAHDTANADEGASVTGLAGLQELAMWPKLFRRLAAFFLDGQTSLSGLDAWLRLDPKNRDDRLLLPNRELGNMHDLVVVQGSTLRLSHRPEDVVIVPDDFVLTPPVTPPEPETQVGPGHVRIVAALVNPVGADRPGETVTLLNTTAADIALSGWFLSDSAGRHALQGTLPRGEAMRVALTAAVQLNNTRDTLTVRDPSGAIVHQVSYEKVDLPAEGHSIVF